MVKHMSYSTIANVLESWEQARQKKDFEETLGVDALLKLFELEPRTKAVFKFDIDYNPTPQELIDSGNLIHAIRMIHMFGTLPTSPFRFFFNARWIGSWNEDAHIICLYLSYADAALNMLGPDTEMLEEILQELGKRHIVYGVSTHFYPVMGQAVLYALERSLGSSWNNEYKMAWVEVYDELSGEIMKSIFNNTKKPWTDDGRRDRTRMNYNEWARTSRIRAP